MIKFTFVTQSAGKLREAQRILGYEIDHADIDLPEIQAIEIEEVVKYKIQVAFDELNKPVMIEDTGLYMTAWHGLPGALIKWFIKTVGEPGICTMLNNSTDRRATVKTVVATYDGINMPQTFIGQVEGHIALAPAGEGGFGWDKIFIPNGATKTFGEMTPEEKDQFSMRRIAFQEMVRFYA